MALFGGAYFSSRRAAFAVPLAAMLLSDIALMASPGFTSASSLLDFFNAPDFAARYGWTSFKWVLPVYACFIATVGIGMLLRRRTLPAAPLAALAASTLFFLVTNCSFLSGEAGIEHGLAGLAEGYIAGLPFFQNAVLGDLFYTALLFGGFELAQRRFGVLRASAPATEMASA
jgi:hypothetical protein